MTDTPVSLQTPPTLFSSGHSGPSSLVTLAGVEVRIAWSGPHDNLADMDSWRRAELPVLPGSGPAPWLHDTATGQLTLASAGPVATLYACGITPYDATHIGHAATYTAWDLLVRAWLDSIGDPGDPRNPGQTRSP